MLKVRAIQEPHIRRRRKGYFDDFPFLAVAQVAMDELALLLSWHHILRYTVSPNAELSGASLSSVRSSDVL